MGEGRKVKAFRRSIWHCWDDVKGFWLEESEFIGGFLWSVAIAIILMGVIMAYGLR
jgi:hypothetical protein